MFLNQFQFDSRSDPDLKLKVGQIIIRTTVSRGKKNVNEGLTPDLGPYLHSQVSDPKHKFYSRSFLTFLVGVNPLLYRGLSIPFIINVSPRNMRPVCQIEEYINTYLLPIHCKLLAI